MVSNRSSWEASDLGYSGIANETIGVSSLSVLCKWRLNYEFLDVSIVFETIQSHIKYYIRTIIQHSQTSFLMRCV